MNLSQVGVCLPSWASAGAVAVVAAVLAAADRLPASDALWIGVSVLTVFIPTGWMAPVGWRRRAAEASLLPVAAALLLVSDLTIRRMLVPPLLVVAGLVAVLAALSKTERARQPLLWAAFGLAVRAAGGLGLVGAGVMPAAAALAASVVVPWAAAKWGARAGLLGGLVMAAVPLQRWPVVAVALMVVAVWSIPWSRTSERWLEHLAGWTPAAVSFALVGSAVAPYGGISPLSALPEVGWQGLLVIAATAALTLRLSPGVAGVIWFLAAVALGPVTPPAPEREAFRIDSESSRVVLPAGTGQPYLIDVGIRGGRDLVSGTGIASVVDDAGERTLRVGVETAEAVRRRAGGPIAIEHGLPRWPVWRPTRVGSPPIWRVSGRTELAVAAGARPTIQRTIGLPAEVTIIVETAGPSTPTPPRDLSASIWLWTGAAVVALLQILTGGWRSAWALTPWSLLVTGQVVARVAVEPLRIVGERHAVDIAMAALLAAWAPAAWRWLRSRRTMAAVAALLVPLALATPRLTPPLYGDEPFHLHVMESLAADHDLDLTNNLDLEHRPGDRTYTLGHPLLHSPVLGFLLLPGWLVAGRAGALLLLALAGAAMAGLVAVRARQLGVPERRLALLLLVLCATYPLATFSTQIWPELPGAFTVAAIVVVAAGPRAGRWIAIGAAAIATAVKTRLGLIVFPAAAAAWWRGRGRLGAAGVMALAAASAGSLAVGWYFMGHPFGYFRRLEHLVPADPMQAIRVVAGLAFDPAGGLLFAGPLLLAAAAFAGLLWRHGGAAERAVMTGGVLTVLALLHSKEWYGGGSPPARYLVPLLPAAALAWGLGLRVPGRLRRLGETLLVPSVMVWWALVTRPHFSINSGDGRWWLSDALARRLIADTQFLVPSFLAPTAASLWVPALVISAVVMVAVVGSRRPAALRSIVRLGTALWLAIAVAITAGVVFRHDRSVEVEASQVKRLGGTAVPPVGTFSRYEHRRGWLVRGGEGVVMPLNVATGARVWLEGWLVGSAQHGATLVVRWDDTDPVTIRVSGAAEDGRVQLPDPPGPGRRQLRIVLRAPPGGGAVLDRAVVEW